MITDDVNLTETYFNVFFTANNDRLVLMSLSLQTMMETCFNEFVTANA